MCIGVADDEGGVGETGHIPETLRVHVGHVDDDPQSVALADKLRPCRRQSRTGIRGTGEAKGNSFREPVGAAPNRSQDAQAAAIVGLQVAQIFTDRLSPFEPENERQSPFAETRFDLSGGAYQADGPVGFRFPLCQRLQNGIGEGDRILMVDLTARDSLISFCGEGQTKARIPLRRFGRGWCEDGEDASDQSSSDRSREIDSSDVTLYKKRAALPPIRAGGCG